MKRIIRKVSKYIPLPVKNLLKRSFDCITWDPWANRSWSQEGEDMVLRRLFESQKEGFYVDVGAHHPKRFSNTYFFYRRGWRGINIDAMPGSMTLFHKCRPRDINLEVGVALEPGSLDYYVFNEPALNGFSSELSKDRSDAKNSYFVERVVKVDVLPLKEIMKKYLDNHKIDFLSIDVEGLDLDVLLSNDWSKYRPKYVLVEILNSNLHDLQNHEIAQFMKNHGYSVYAKQMNTVFFQNQDSNELI